MPHLVTTALWLASVALAALPAPFDVAHYELPREWQTPVLETTDTGSPPACMLCWADSAR